MTQQELDLVETGSRLSLIIGIVFPFLLQPKKPCRAKVIRKDVFTITYAGFHGPPRTYRQPVIKVRTTEGVAWMEVSTRYHDLVEVGDPVPVLYQKSRFYHQTQRIRAMLIKPTIPFI